MPLLNTNTERKRKEQELQRFERFPQGLER